MAGNFLNKKEARPGDCVWIASVHCSLLSLQGQEDSEGLWLPLEPHPLDSSQKCCPPAPWSDERRQEGRAGGGAGARSPARALLLFHSDRAAGLQGVQVVVESHGHNL